MEGPLPRAWAVSDHLVSYRVVFGTGTRSVDTSRVSCRQRRGRWARCPVREYARHQPVWENQKPWSI